VANSRAIFPIPRSADLSNLLDEFERQLIDPLHLQMNLVALEEITHGI
jgi:hypothetical protein